MGSERRRLSWGALDPKGVGISREARFSVAPGFQRSCFVFYFILFFLRHDSYPLSHGWRREWGACVYIEGVSVVASHRQLDLGGPAGQGETPGPP